MSKPAAAWLAVAALAATPAFAQPVTVCTVTVNSSDEREALREFLPGERYRFVELAQPLDRGASTTSWLGHACAERVRCDVLVVSGHFAGTAFYSSKHGEHVSVDEMERVACSASCPDLFAHLKEVYLFGCDSLKPDPVKSAMPEVLRGLVRAGHTEGEAAALARELSLRNGESARDRMRRLFPGVPVIYGFSSLAPYGRVAGPMLRRHLANGGAAEFGSGRPSAALLKLFGPSSMTATSGQLPGDADAPYRAEACRYYDDRVSNGQRLDFMHAILGGEVHAMRMAFDRIERFLASLDEQARREPELSTALARLADDAAARASYLGATRETRDPALRVRMLALARDVGWLTRDGHRAELGATIAALIGERSAGYGEVDLVCALNREHGLQAEGERLRAAALRSGVFAAAALACLGNPDSRGLMLRSLASADEAEVQMAQAYFRYNAIADVEELRAAVRAVAAMKAPSAQVRALEVLARQHVADPRVAEELLRLYARTTHLGVQRAIAEVFLRASPEALSGAGTAATLRRHRLKPPAGDEVLDTVLRRLPGA